MKYDGEESENQSESENHSHDEGVDAEGGVSHDVKEASTRCGCAWLGQNNLKENVVKYFHNFAVFFAVYAQEYC